jgi:hypothetical protein
MLWLTAPCTWARAEVTNRVLLAVRDSEFSKTYIRIYQRSDTSFRGAVCISTARDESIGTERCLGPRLLRWSSPRQKQEVQVLHVKVRRVPRQHSDSILDLPHIRYKFSMWRFVGFHDSIQIPFLIRRIFALKLCRIEKEPLQAWASCWSQTSSTVPISQKVDNCIYLHRFGFILRREHP